MTGSRGATGTAPTTDASTSARALTTARPVRTRRAGGMRAVAVTLATLLIAALLNASSLATTAASQPAGWGRDLALAVTEPLVTLSSVLGLDRPRAWLETTLGREPAGLPPPVPTAAPVPDDRDPTDAPSAGPTTPAPTDGTLPGPAPSDAPTGAPTPTEPATDPTTTPTAPAYVASPQRPAALWVVGDSMTETFGPALVNLGLATGVIEPDHELRYSSGLTRPDFHDWPAHLEDRLARSPADIVVFMIGANDAQPILLDGEWVPFGEPGWETEYRRRVQRVAEILAGGSRTVYWVGQPIPRPGRYRERMAFLNEVYREVAGGHPDVRYVSSWELFRGADGGYADYLPGEDGRTVLVRRTDGIHLTTVGGEWLAAHVLDAVRQDWRLESDVPPADA